MEHKRSQAGKELQNVFEVSENEVGFMGDAAKLALLRTGRLPPADFSLHFDFMVSAIKDKIQIPCWFQR